MYHRRFWLVFSLALAAIGRNAATGADITEPPNTEPSTTKALPPAEAASGFRVPEGFHVNVFAAEPDVRNPVAMAWDTRGRLWVAENYTYSDSNDKFNLGLRDRVLIFEDADADGKFDKRTVFTEDVQRLGSVELGFGGVWLICPPQLLFVPDRDGNDVPDGPAEVVLDGFTVALENHHTFANGLRWGPDGWLYGRCGASSPGQIGVPGTPEADRIPLRGGLWRYHPTRKRFEVLAHGTTNPWGHDWNSLGEAFFINTVNGHLWHLIPGAHLARPHTIEPNPWVYSVIDQHADHYHFDNSKDFNRFTVPGSIDDRRGGGHAHSGMMIYQGDQWPESFRDKLFTLNFHGRRVNVERLERSGSGYVGRHEPDILFAADPWFRGVDLSYGPDGSVFVLDWSDTGECHDHDGIHRTSGRIYRITQGKVVPPQIKDVSRLKESELVALHQHPNEWFARKARRVLAERAAQGEKLEEAKAGLGAIFESDPDLPHQIRALLSLYTIGGADETFLRKQLEHEHESVRAWAIRFLTDGWPIDTIFSKRGGPDVDPPLDLRERLSSLARNDPSALVRLVLASTLQRLPVNRRAAIAGPLVARSEDKSDPNLPSLIWTALIPVAESTPNDLVGVATSSRIGEVTRMIARRLGEDIETNPGPLNGVLLLATLSSDEEQAPVLTGLSEALAGWRKANKPQTWDRFNETLATSTDPKLREKARDLNVLFGDGRALDEVRRLALDESASLDIRRSALKSLIENRPPDLRATCERLLKVRFLNAVAVRGLALFDDPAVGRKIAASYRSFHPSERPITLDTLSSRPTFANALLDQVAAGTIPRQDLTPFHARQIRSLGDPAIIERLAQVWGVLRESSADRRERIATLKAQLDPTKLLHADRGRGRAVFDRVCGSCHKLYGYGGEIGPDLTGTGRDNLAYLLENLVDPSASVSADFRMVVVALKDGRVLNGQIRTQTVRTLTLQTQTAPLILDRKEIEGVKSSALSLMPEGLLDTLSKTEVQDLIAYLMSRTQVPLPRPER